jgi:hypothetical protein
MPAQQPIDIATWEIALRYDTRLSGSARMVARVLAHHFIINNGYCQRSVERIADEANIISQSTVRHSLSVLKLAGWIAAEHVADSARHGLRYHPTMPKVRKRFDKDLVNEDLAQRSG